MFAPIPVSMWNAIAAEKSGARNRGLTFDEAEAVTRISKAHSYSLKELIHLGMLPDLTGQATHGDRRNGRKVRP